jgi:hypothetical protein
MQQWCSIDTKILSKAASSVTKYFLLACSFVIRINKAIYELLASQQSFNKTKKSTY